MYAFLQIIVITTIIPKLRKRLTKPRLKKTARGTRIDLEPKTIKSGPMLSA